MLDFWKMIKRLAGKWSGENIPDQGNGTWRIRETRTRPCENGGRVSLLGQKGRGPGVEAGRAGGLQMWAEAGTDGLVCASQRQ